MTLDHALPALDELVSTTAADNHCPSVVWGIVADGRLAHVGAAGSLHDGTAPTDRTVYRIASMTKSFTAAAILTLRDEGIMSLDDAIVDHAPELAAVASIEPGAATIRIRDLLSMSAGFATDDAWADRHLDITDDELDHAISAGLLFAGRPGDTYEYSNLGFGLLGRVVQRATGRRVQDLISERLVAPLGMVGTTWVQPQHDDWARPFCQIDDLAVADGPPLGDGGLGPMGGLWTTLADLARWVAWLDDAHRVEGSDDVLSRASRREMQQMHRFGGLEEHAGRTIAAGYGFGLDVHDDQRIGRSISHGGGLPGYGSTMRWLPGRRFGIIAFANITYAPMTTMGLAMIEVLADHDALPDRATVDGTLVHQLGAQLIELLGDWDDRTADRLFTDNVAQDDTYDRRRVEAQGWVDACGGQLVVRSFDVESPTSGRVSVMHPSGVPLWIDFQIAPLRPPCIQLYGYELETS